MSSTGDARLFVLTQVQEKNGSQFDENDVHPDNRSTIGRLTDEIQQIWDLQQQASANLTRATFLEKRRRRLRRRAIYGVVFGLIFASVVPNLFTDVAITAPNYDPEFIQFMGVAFFWFGVIMIVAGVVNAFRSVRGRTESGRLREKISQLQTEAANRLPQWNTGISKLAEQIQNDLTLVYERRLTPRIEKVIQRVDFSEVLRIVKEGGIKLKTIQCPVCQAPLKLPERGSTVKCEACGNLIEATDISEMISDIVGGRRQRRTE